MLDAMHSTTGPVFDIPLDPKCHSIDSVVFSWYAAELHPIFSVITGFTRIMVGFQTNTSMFNISWISTV